MQNDMQNCEVLILGAGPSGMSTALHLAERAPKLIPGILVLEKAHHPRPKLCAGGLVSDAEVILERLGLDVSEVEHADATAAHLDFGGRGFTMQSPPKHVIRVIRRDRFDAWLVGKARARGIEIREGVTVKKVVADETGVTVETDQGTYRARVVVGADGSNGVTRRSVLPQAPIHTARVLEVITGLTGSKAPTGTNPLKPAEAHGTDHAYLDFFPVPSGIAGYVWDFPTIVDGQPMRCWGIGDANILPQADRPPLKDMLAQEMSRNGFDLGQYELQGHPIRWFSPFSPLSVARVLLVGDAVGADALFGEGISPALGFGMLAADAIVSAFARDDFSFRDYRRRALLSPLGQWLSVRWIIAQVAYRLRWPWIQRILWGTLLPRVALFRLQTGTSWGRRMA